MPEKEGVLMPSEGYQIRRVGGRLMCLRKGVWFII